MLLFAGVFPSFAKEGWTRPKENAAKHPLKGADGVVVSNDRLFVPNDCDNRWLETTSPAAPASERDHFLYGAATPPSQGRAVQNRTNGLARVFPFFAKKGWLRHKEKVRLPCWRRRGSCF